MGVRHHLDVQQPDLEVDRRLVTARIASMAGEEFGAGVIRCLESRTENDEPVWDQAMITEAATEVKLSAQEVDLVEQFKEGTQPLLDGADGKLPLLHRSAKGGDGSEGVLGSVRLDPVDQEGNGR